MNKTTPKDQEPKVEEPKMADTIALAVENGLVSIDPTLETDVAELKKVDETADTVKLEMPDGEIVEIDKASIVEQNEIEEIDLDLVDECIAEETTSCADHISRTKILNVIESTMAKYEGKVVLAMAEVRDIIKAITTAVNE